MENLSTEYSEPWKWDSFTEQHFDRWAANHFNSRTDEVKAKAKVKKYIEEHGDDIPWNATWQGIIRDCEVGL